MSGHAGIYYYDHRPIDRSLADRLGVGLSRQGPDGGSQHFGEGLLMVYRAFHFDPLSRRERQPYTSSGGNWITFDGRLDNRDDLLLLVRDRLQDDATDVALAMAAYEKWGTLGFNRLIGDWSVALWDANRQSVVLASDYMGVRPLYYYVASAWIAWSSDLEVLASWMDCANDLDNYYIAAFLQGNPSYERTIYNEVSFVPCGRSVEVRQRTVSKTGLWHPPAGNRIRYRDEHDYEENLLRLFREAVLSRLRTDLGVCCDLSGGLDSSSIVCMAHYLIQTGAASPARLATFSVIDSAADDKEYIPIVEKYCGLQGLHVEPSLDWSLEASVGPMPYDGKRATEILANTLREHKLAVRITGRGGDDMMGNTLDDTDQLADALRDLRVRSFLKNAYTWARFLRLPLWQVLRRAAVPLLPFQVRQEVFRRRSSMPEEAYSHVQKRTCLNPQFLVAYSTREEPEEFCDCSKAAPSQRYFLSGIHRSQQRHGLGPSHAERPLQPTHPYFHRPLVEFVTSIPHQQLCQPGRPRDLMRRAFSGFLPLPIRERRTKALGGTVQGLSLYEVATVLLSGHKPLQTDIRGYIHANRLREILESPQSTTYDVNEVVAALTLEIWLRNRSRVTAHDEGTTTGSIEHFCRTGATAPAPFNMAS